MWILGPILLVVILVLAFIALKYQERAHLTQYLFFIRYPILVGLLLVGLPFLGPRLAPTSLTNLFEMGWKSAFVVSGIACLLIWSIIHVAVLIWISVPQRCQLPFDRSSNWERDAEAYEAQLKARKYDLISSSAAAISLILGVPLAARIVLYADGPWWMNLLAVFVGAVLAWLIREASSHYAKARRVTNSYSTPAADLADKKKPRTVAAPLRHVYGAFDPTLHIVHIRALRFFVSAFLIYLLLGVAACPIVPVVSDIVPALAIALALLMVGVWVLGFIGFVFDRDRIPVIAVMVTLLIILQLLRPAAIQFQVSSWGTHKTTKSTDVLTAWNSSHPSKQPVIVAAASGGGIRATLWTAEVLAGLERDVEDFHNRIAVLSSVSGGSVSSAYYIDRFSQFTSTSAELDKLIEDAGTSSLTAAAWGLGYPDLWRGVCGNLYRWDRGWALEQAWGHRMERPGQTLGDWVDDAAAGSRPLVIFNATIQESGERLLLSPAAMPAQNGLKDLFTFVPGHDMPVLTAVRLSASFPYISPQASPKLDSSERDKALHVADGGYYDNSGLLTCVDVLDDVFASKNSDFPKRIALIEIRASKRIDQVAPVKPDTDVLQSAVFGPIETLYNVQSNSQIVRTNWELSMQQQKWLREYGVDCRHFIFHLSGELPLSWQLTDAEKHEIRSHWPSAGEQPTTPEATDARKDNKEELERLKSFLNEA